MKRASFCTVLLLSLVFASAATAQSPITGTWITTAFDGIPNLIDLEVNGSTVVGAISRDLQTYAIHDGRVDGNTVTFKVTSAWGGLRRTSFTGTLNNDVLSFRRSVESLPGIPVTGGGQGIFRADGLMEFEARRQTADASGIPRGMLGNWKPKMVPTVQPMLGEVMTIVAHPGGWFSITTAGANPNGAPFFTQVAIKADGREYPSQNAQRIADLLISGTPTAVTVSARMVDAKTLEFTTRNNGTITSTNHSFVSSDGNTLTGTVRAFNAAGEVTSVNTWIWERLFSAYPDDDIWCIDSCLVSSNGE